MPEYNYLKYIRVYGLPEDDEECFQGLGASRVSSASGGTSTGDTNVAVSFDPNNLAITLESAEGSTDVDAALWTAQSGVIKSQSDQFKKVKQQLATKWEDIPAKLKAQNVKESLVEEFLKWLADTAATYFWGKVAGEIAELVVTLGAAAIRFLDALYTEGEAMCDALIAENTALLNVTATLANYDLRSTVIVQHAQVVDALLREIDDNEKQVASQQDLASILQGLRSELKQMNVTLEMIQAEDNIVQCPHSGDAACMIYTKSLAMDVKEG